ncbi:MAG: hypothetical protein HETSPECPRED_004987 [Heterodermia speciosa]|uniref:Uncharacterized protein n=1 Tax=Heterodermia speciosa TaxID=116794 RepID=A0A8H3FA20_9LECA|nr:MAG: hypothetical protein HETSPECPRED_004987 [Heterodermia speciosa]
MRDTTALVALVVAAVALIIALAQLVQQLLATAYVIRKCDTIVTGSLTRGGTRQWHWRQFRFTVKYQCIVFTLPRSVYAGLGINSTIRIDPTVMATSASRMMLDRARETRPRRTSAQACWISLLQDLAAAGCLVPEDICTREESGDRIPDDLTVAPTRVDCMTILLTSIAMGMQVFRYSPTTGEIVLGGSSGSISSSNHPVLGGLLHYSVFSEEPSSTERTKHHAHALRHSEGVWANGVFGRFRDISFKPEMVSLWTLMNRKMPVLQSHGWSDGLAAGDADSGAGAACFMAVGHVDIYEIAPPSVFRDYAAHFAEVIVKAHHVELLKLESELRSSANGHLLQMIVNELGYILPEYKCSSPYLIDEDSPLSLSFYQLLISEDPKASGLIPAQSLLKLFEPLAEDSWHHLCINEQDPSSYCSPDLLWDMLRLVDVHIRLVHNQVPPPFREVFRVWSDEIVAGSIRTLSQIGPPSWGNASFVVKKWPDTVASFHKDAMSNIEKTCGASPEHLRVIRGSLRLHAELSALRSAYCTVMMRAAHALGPGLTTKSNIETALAYMA